METPEQHKLRAVRITASARFSAANRLRRHETYSLFSITMCSLAVVVISLLEPFGVMLLLPSNAINLFSAGISLLILVVSLMVSGNKYGERAEKMHAGAVEINSVARRLEPAIQSNNVNAIAQLTDEYENILKIYENHKEIDYKVARIKAYPEHYKINFSDRACCWLLLQWDVVPHLIPLLLMAGLSYFVAAGAHL